MRWRLTRWIQLGTLTLLIVAADAATASAQSQLPSVVQLPSFRFFSYSGSVIVPDGGAASLSGNSHASQYRIRRGGHRGLHRFGGQQQAVAGAQIIDQAEIDRQLLGATPQQFLAASRASDRIDHPSQSAVDPQAEGKALVRYARQQYRQGQKADAFEAYLAAIDVLNGHLHTLAAAEFRRVFGAAADQALRMTKRHR